MRFLVLLGICISILTDVHSQVPVSKEPRHHVVFENDKFRILNVFLPAADTTQYHIHSTPSVFVSFTKTRTVSQNIGKDPVPGISAPGQVWFENLNPPYVKVHRVWNADTGMFHVMDVEILVKDSGFTSIPFKAAHVELLIDTPWVRIYSIKLENGEQVSIGQQKSAFVLVAVNEANLQLVENGMESRSSVVEGNFYLIKPGDTFSVLNRSDMRAKFALLEMLTVVPP